MSISPIRAQAPVDRPGRPEVRPEKLLNIAPRLADIDALLGNRLFEKIDLIGKNIKVYAYSSEGADDTGWGCAWRATQTMLSSLDIEVPSYPDLYKDHCTKAFMQEQFAKLYPREAKKNHPWKAPIEDWHMWADPFVARAILEKYGIKGSLFAVNEAPKVLSPNVNDATYSFKEFRDLMVEHFEKEGAALVIDNGSFALNVLGIGRDGDKTYLLIGDPHLLIDRDDHELNGLYVVELDKEGKQVSIDYPRKEWNFEDELNGFSYEKVDFSPGTKWLVTQARQYAS